MVMMRRPMSGGGAGNPYTRSAMANPPQSGGMYGGSPQPRGDMTPKSGVSSPMAPSQNQQFYMGGMANGYANSGISQLQAMERELAQAQAAGAPPSVISALQMRLQQAQQNYQRQTQMAQAQYGARGGQNPYVAQLIGLGYSGPMTNMMRAPQGPPGGLSSRGF